MGKVDVMTFIVTYSEYDPCFGSLAMKPTFVPTGQRKLAPNPVETTTPQPSNPYVMTIYTHVSLV